MQSITPDELLLLVQALPLSLATTQGIEFSFFSCRYLDVSVPCVPLLYTTLLMYGLVSFFPDQSFLIRISVDIMDICSSPQLFAAYHVLLRLLVPRHSPYALSSLTFLLCLIFVLLCQTSSKFFQCTLSTISKISPRFPCTTRLYFAILLRISFVLLLITYTQHFSQSVCLQNSFEFCISYP